MIGFEWLAHLLTLIGEKNNWKTLPHRQGSSSTKISEWFVK
jgi:hypothetical protein